MGGEIILQPPKSYYQEEIMGELEAEELLNKIGTIQVSPDIAFVIKSLMETWLPVTTRIVPTNGFITHVLASKLPRKENGFVRHVLPIWLDVKDGNRNTRRFKHSYLNNIVLISDVHVVNYH